MFEKFKEYMKKSFNYEVQDFAVYETEFKPNKIIPVTVSIFVVALLLYVLDLIFNWGIMNLVILAVLFIVLVIVPLALNKSDKYQAVFVTPDYLVQRISRTEYVGIKFDDITSYQNTKDGIVISDKDSTITLGLSLYRHEIEGIIDILEAKGKTFDPDKKFMIRPVEIIIKNNKISLVEQEVETLLDRVYAKYADDYLMLTPGYADEISFRNVHIDNLCIDEEYNNVSFTMEMFEVRDGHPENTTFESITALDGILIMHDLVVKSLVLKNQHDASVKDEKLPNEITELVNYLNKATIIDWKTRTNGIEFLIATGIYHLTAKFQFKDIIIGWNKTKG